MIISIEIILYWNVVIACTVFFFFFQSILTVNDEDHQQQNLSLLKQRIQTCMDRLDGNIESSQVLIHTLLQQLNLGDPRRTSVVEDAEATVQLVRIQTTDDRGMLM